MKCFVCDGKANLKDFSDVYFCSKDCLIKNYKEDTKVIVDMLIEEGMIQEVEHE